MTDKCTSPEGHKEYGPWRIRYSTYLAQIKIERTNGRLVEEMPKEEAHRILNSHASLTEKVEIEHEQVCQFIRDMYTGRFAEREKYYWELPQWIRDAIEADPIYSAEEQEDE